jgi:hypothetical protein
MHSLVATGCDWQALHATNLNERLRPSMAPANDHANALQGIGGF